jgi:acyl carrier protein
MQPSEISEALKGFIIDEILHGDGADLDEDTPLLEWGVIDSLAMVALLGFIQKTFGVRVPDAEVVPRNFHSIAAMQRLVVREVGGPCRA